MAFKINKAQNKLLNKSLTFYVGLKLL